MSGAELASPHHYLGYSHNRQHYRRHYRQCERQWR